MSSNKRFVISLIVFILVMLLFVFTAAIEYNRSYQSHVEEAQDELQLIKLNLENLISSRMVAISGLKAHVEIHPNFNQSDFNYFAQGIYDSSNDIVQSMAFITDTTLTHIYPYEDYESIIGMDLSQNQKQKPWIIYAKDNEKAIITAPVNLIEGGVGIIVRIPVLRQDEYFGQVSIVFDYEATLLSSGLYRLADDYYVELDKTNEITESENVLWTNFNLKEINRKEMVFEQVKLYDSNMSLVAIPKGGFDGKSLLFYIILLIGLIIATLSSVIVYKLLTITIALKLSEVELKDNNEELEAMVNQLQANEVQLYGQYNEINEQKKHIEFLADCDYLTGLNNRRRFTEDITQFINNSKKGTVLLFDIDNFKNINDTQGHHYGDKVLKHIGLVLKESLFEHADIYRIGGDEFAIHLPEIIEPNKIEGSIQSFFKALKDNNYVEQIKNHITASVGIAKYPSDSMSVDDLLMKSDIAMYQAKNDGKNRYCYFSKKLISKFDNNVKIEKELRNALEQHQFKLLYQPIINALSGEIDSLEALIRIEDSHLSPIDFIPVAENSGLIIPMGNWVIDQVCKQLNAWREKYDFIKPVAINISAKQLYDDSIIEYIHKALNKYNLSPDLLEIEITESVLIENSAHTIHLLSLLRHIGIKISLDDFGTGYSSLSYLSYMTVDKVKIDKSLKDKFLFLEKAVVMKGIIDICQGLNLKVVTEGVETKEEYDQLKMYGVDFIQGYYFEKPINAERVTAILDKNYMIHK